MHILIEYINNLGGFPALCGALLSINFLIFLVRMGSVMRNEPITQEDIIEMGNNCRQSSKLTEGRKRLSARPRRKRSDRIK